MAAKEAKHDALYTLSLCLLHTPLLRELRSLVLYTARNEVDVIAWAPEIRCVPMKNQRPTASMLKIECYSPIGYWWFDKKHRRYHSTTIVCHTRNHEMYQLALKKARLALIKENVSMYNKNM